MRRRENSSLRWAKGLAWPFSILWGRWRAQPLLHAALLVSWGVYVALLAAVPMYSDAANQYLLQQELALGKADTPQFAFYFHHVGAASEPLDPAAFAALDGYLVEGAPSQLGLSRTAQQHFVTSDLFRLYRAETDARSSDLLHVKLGSIADLGQVTELIEGAQTQPMDSMDEIDVLASQALAEEVGLAVGDEFVLFRSDLNLPATALPSQSSPTSGKGDGTSATAVRRQEDDSKTRVQLTVRVSGIWAPRQNGGETWYVAPSAFERTLLMPMVDFHRLAANGTIPDLLYNFGYYDVYDGGSVRADNATGFVGRIRSLERRVSMLAPGTALEVSPEPALNRFRRRAAQQTVQLFGFVIPFIGIVLYFMVGVSGSIVARQQGEIAVFRSRGASQRQILALYALQILAVSAVAAVAGLYLGQLAVRHLGLSHAFLEFGTSPLDPQVTQTSRRAVAAGLAFAGLTSLAPAVAASRRSIVQAALERARFSSGWRRLRWTLCVVTLGAALYGRYLLSSRVLERVLPTSLRSIPQSDPILFLAPALFISAVSLAVTLLFPLVPSLLAWICQGLRGVIVLLSLRNLQRGARRYEALLLLLVMCVGLAVYTASAATTLDRDSVERHRYAVGADIVLREGAGVASGEGESGGWKMLPVDKHLEARGVRAATAVSRVPTRADMGGQQILATYVGIDRLTFPAVAHYSPRYAPESLGVLMNALAENPSGLLVSRDLLTRTGLMIGDPVTLFGLDPMNSQAVRFSIVGVYDYFPAQPLDGGPAVVGNMGYIEQELGGKPIYDVWLGLEPEADTQTVLDDLYDIGFRVISHDDSGARIARERSDPGRAGVFGFLSVGFLITVGLCLIMQAIQAVIAFRRQSIQFGVLRALGMSRQGLSLALGLEMVLVVAAGLGAGLGLGLVASRMYLPLLQVGQDAAYGGPPMAIFIDWPRALQAALVVCLDSLAVSGLAVARLARVRMTEVLKLGGGAV